MIAIIDYGMGNLRSVQKAFEHVGAQTCIIQTQNDLRKAEKIVLPGVGAMKPAMIKLESLKLIDVLKTEIRNGKPFLGICLGFQLLFEQSDEGGDVKGLGVLTGNVCKFKSLKIPQIGWNQLDIRNTTTPLFKNIAKNSNVYFCHSYYVETTDKDCIAAVTNYGIEYTSAVSKDNIFGVQFHPEKSQSIGLTILKNFTEISL